MKNKKYGICFVVLTLTLVLVAGMTGVCTSQASAEQKTLKIGCIAFFGFPLGLDFARGVELLAEVINDKGGLDIGGGPAHNSDSTGAARSAGALWP